MHQRGKMKGEYEPNHCVPEEHESDNTGSPEKVMFRNQGAVRLSKPLKSDGSESSR